MLGGRRFLFACALSAAAALLVLGLVHLPFIRLSSLLLIGHGVQEHSIVRAALAALRNGQLVALGGALVLFAIGLPVLRWLYLLTRRESAPESPRLRTLVWWPQDLIALAAAGTLVATQEALRQHIAPGAYCFAGAIVATAVAYLWRRRASTAGTASAAAGSKRGGPVLMALTGLALLTFGLGLTQPVVRLAGATGDAGQSILDLLRGQQKLGQITLWVPLAVLALVLPGLRLLYLLTALVHPIRLAERLGRPATADIIVLSLGLFYLMETGAAERVLLPGAYCLAASAALALLGYMVAVGPLAATASAAATAGSTASSRAPSATTAPVAG